MLFSCLNSFSDKENKLMANGNDLMVTFCGLHGPRARARINLNINIARFIFRFYILYTGKFSFDRLVNQSWIKYQLCKKE